MIDLDLLAKEVDFTFARASGPGGQHVNKTDSAVWLYHRPTGTRFKVDTTRSQYQNKQIALERLAQILLERKVQARHALDQYRHIKRAKIRPNSVKRKNLEFKKKTSQKKANRRNTFED